MARILDRQRTVAVSEHDSEERSPEQMLWISVLMLLIRDCQMANSPNKKSEVRDCLYSPWMVTMCGFAGFDPSWFRAQADKALAKGDSFRDKGQLVRMHKFRRAGQS